LFLRIFFVALLLGLDFRVREESRLAFRSPVPAFAQAVAEIVKLFGNHHKVVVQSPIKHPIVDLSFIGAAEPGNARRKLAVGPVLKNALA
jgi:hypothetical protein